MTTTKVTKVSWFDRLKNSVLGIGAGIVLIIGMIALLWWNEGRAVQTQRSLSEGSGLVASVPAGVVDPANEGQLVHLTGALSTDDLLSDDNFLVRAEGVRLVRNVEMFQWLESSTTSRQQNLGGSETRTTTYSYALGWSDRRQDSSKFQDTSHQNPPMSHTGSTFRLESAELEAFTVGRNVLDRVGGAERLELPPEFEEPLRERFGEDVSIVDGAIYLGANPAQPVLGDHRVSYELVPLGTISVVGAQQGNGLAAYATRAGDSLLMVRQGVATAQEMFDAAASSNNMMTWVLRAAGLMLLITGFSMLLKPLSVLASVLPFLGRLVGAATGLVAAVFGVAIGTLTIAAAWLAFRPLVSVIVLVVGAGLVFAIRQQIVRRRQEATADSGTEATANTTADTSADTAADTALV